MQTTKITNMKKLITTCALVALGSVASFAQAQKSNVPDQQASATATNQDAAAEKTATKNAKEYQKQLALRNDQYKLVYQAEYDYAKQSEAYKAQGFKPTDGASQQLIMMRDQRIQNTLTPDQFTKYKQISEKVSGVSLRTN